MGGDLRDGKPFIGDIHRCWLIDSPSRAWAPCQEEENDSLRVRLRRLARPECKARPSEGGTER